jgi:hypothetical protein
MYGVYVRFEYLWKSSVIFICTQVGIQIFWNMSFSIAPLCDWKQYDTSTFYPLVDSIENFYQAICCIYIYLLFIHFDNVGTFFLHQKTK